MLAFDMGGTTAKLCLVDDGRPLVGYGFEAARVHRFKRGSGLPLRVPAIDLIEIGSGGGSIGRLDSLGLLKVGPDSAGADPGPAAYGRGAGEPTVTDADLLLDYLDPDSFLGGELRLDRTAARTALTGRLAAPLGRDLTEVAWGMHEIVNEQMASAARIHVAERGRDPRRYALVATGGAGPVHACRIARKLGVGRVLCPLGSGVASPVGLLVAPPRVDLVEAYVARLDELDWDRLQRIYDRLRREATDFLGQLGVAPAAIRFAPLADLRYVGRGFEVQTPLPAPPGGPRKPDASAAGQALREAFSAAYRSRYGRVVQDAEIESLHWRLSAAGRDRARGKPAPSTLPGGGRRAGRDRSLPPGGRLRCPGRGGAGAGPGGGRLTDVVRDLVGHTGLRPALRRHFLRERRARRRAGPGRRRLHQLPVEPVEHPDRGPRAPVPPGVRAKSHRAGVGGRRTVAARPSPAG